jgi:hypothetical protein
MKPIERTAMTEPLVPLVTIAAELRCNVDVLVRRFAGDILIDEAGLRCIPASVSREYLAKVHAEAREVHRQALRMAAERAAQGNPLRERVRRIQARQDQLGDPIDGAALARMMESDGARDAELDRAAATRHELMTGTTVYHKLQEGN